ncbi:MAG TPA: hypothetical protein VIM11_19280 [Tepidisphaeraceae bacterium]|jgi:hypothetical protein
MKIKIFTVFHRAVDERLIFDAFQPSEIDRYFTHYGVNESHPRKRVIRRDGRTFIAGAADSNSLLEFQLDWYDPAIQSRGFMETSCYVHLLKNRLHESLDYIGVAQYDMRWPDSAAAILRILSEQPLVSSRTVYGMVCGRLMDTAAQFHPLAFAQLRNWPFLLESYNRFFGQKWDARMLIDKPLTLWQTYLLPNAIFEDLAAWLHRLCEEVFPWATQPPYETHWGALSGYTERAESLFIAARLAEGAIDLENLPLEHDSSIPQKLSIAKEHYGQIV